MFERFVSKTIMIKIVAIAIVMVNVKRFIFNCSIEKIMAIDEYKNLENT